MNNDWAVFIEAYAKPLHLLFSDQALVKQILVDAGNKGFQFKKAGEYVTDLQNYIDWWADLKEAIASTNPRMWEGHDEFIFQACHKRRVPVKRGNDAAIIGACAAFVEDWKRNYQWAYPCPICNAPTIRFPKFDFLFKKDETYAWYCTNDPNAHTTITDIEHISHFAQAVAKARAVRIAKARRLAEEKQKEVESGIFKTVEIPQKAQAVFSVVIPQSAMATKNTAFRPAAAIPV